MVTFSADRVNDVLQQFERDQEMIAQNQHAWLEQWSECWVAVYKGKVIGRGRTYDELMRAVPTEDSPYMAMGRLVHNPPLLLL